MSWLVLDPHTLLMFGKMSDQPAEVQFRLMFPVREAQALKSIRKARLGKKVHSLGAIITQINQQLFHTLDKTSQRVRRHTPDHTAAHKGNLKENILSVQQTLD